MRAARVFLTGLAVAAWLPAASPEKQRVETRSVERFPFAPGGTIEVRNSFGELKIEVWEHPQVEIEVTKGTHKKYSQEEEARAMEHLDRISVQAVRKADDRLVLSTGFPSRSLFYRPLRGKSNLRLVYRIKVPENVNLVVSHDVGSVEAAGLLGNIHITGRIGDISLRLPESQEWQLDARARIGDVDSQFGPPTRRRLLVGAQLRDRPAGQARRVYLRLGIGGISIKKTPGPRYRIV